MKIDFLREFVTLAKLLNFRKASERLHISQPGLSRHIIALEREIGVQLFNRNTHNVELTQGGQLLLEYLPDFLEFYDRMISKVKSGAGGILRIAGYMYNQEVSTIISRAINLFKTEYPHVDLFVESDPKLEFRKMLIDGDSDIAIIANFGGPNDGLTYFDLLNEPVVVRMGKDNPLVHKKTVSFVELQKMTLRLRPFYGGNKEWSDFISGLFEQRGLEPKQGESLDDSLCFNKNDYTFSSIDFIKHERLDTGNHVAWLDEPISTTLALAYSSYSNNPLILHFVDTVRSAQRCVQGDGRLMVNSYTS